MNPSQPSTTLQKQKTPLHVTFMLWFSGMLMLGLLVGLLGIVAGVVWDVSTESGRALIGQEITASKGEDLRRQYEKNAPANTTPATQPAK